MTDRELLELAAKAAGVEHEGWTTGRSEEPEGGLTMDANTADSDVH